MLLVLDIVSTELCSRQMGWGVGNAIKSYHSQFDELQGSQIFVMIIIADDVVVVVLTPLYLNDVTVSVVDRESPLKVAVSMCQRI